MTAYSVLGLFHEATPTAKALDELRGMGISDEKITVMSGIPYRPEILGRPRPRRPVTTIALIGAILGLLVGVFLTVGIFLLYPLTQGGQPTVPIPPTLIVLFETTMLGTMWAAFFGLLGENRFPVFKRQAYDPRLTEGHIGVLVQVEETGVEQAERVLRDNGAHHMHRERATEQTHLPLTAFWATFGGAVLALTAVVLLIAYDVLKIHFPTNMADQDSVAYLQGPRRGAPGGSVSIQGPALIAGQPASLPVPSSDDSLQRGSVLFDINCAMCHGTGGQGDGPLSGFFSPPPANLRGDELKALNDEEIYLVITQGFGHMPSLAENLDPVERWDVVNYVRSLQEGPP